MVIVPMGQAGRRIADGVHLLRCDPRKCIPRPAHAHAFHQLTLMLSSPGRVEWRFGEGTAYAGRPSAGDVVVCPALMPTRVRWERPFESVTIRIAPDTLAHAADRARLGIGLSPGIRRDRFAGEVALKLAEDVERGGHGLFGESLGAALSIHLLREYAEVPRSREGPRLSSGDLRRVTDYIEAHLAAGLRVEALAALAGLSPDHFLRCFRASTGVTPHQYVINRRVDRARELLVGGSGIAEAALAVGFSSQSHLHRHVRRRLGVTPGALARVSEHPR